jgi:hypothetical protein
MISSKHVLNKDNAPVVLTQATILQDEAMSPEELAYLFPDEEVVPYYSSQTPDSVAALTKQSVVPEAIIIVKSTCQ